MTKEHNNLGWIIHRASEEMYATKKIAEVTSWPEAINTFCAKFKMLDEPYDALKWKVLTKEEATARGILSSARDFFWKAFQAIGKLFRWVQNQFYCLTSVDVKPVMRRAPLLGFLMR